MKSLLLPLFVTGVVSVNPQTTIRYSFNSQSDLNQSDRFCRQNKQVESCLLPQTLLGNSNLYPSVLRQATDLLLARWQSPWQLRKKIKLDNQLTSLLPNKLSENKQQPNKLLLNNKPLSAQFPVVSRGSLMLSSPQQKKIKDRSLLVHPVPATKHITSSYGWRRRPYSGQWQFHRGIDYGAPLGSTVVAANNGVVINVVSGCVDFGNKWCGSQFGNWIEIDHGNGIIATYAHLLNQSIVVREGMKVQKNQEIAKVGSSGWSTGAHLDFRLKVNGNYQNPRDFVSAKSN